MKLYFDFLPLFIVLVLAWLCPIITSQLRAVRIPSVVVEIIAGLVIGEHVLDILPDAEYMRFLGLTGFVFLMFLSGLEIDVHKIVASLPRGKLSLKQTLSNPLLSGLSIYLCTLTLAIGGAALLSHFVPIQHIWYFALIISTSSVGVILPVLKDRAEIGTRYGQMIILAAVVADILSILMFTFTASVVKNGPKFEVLIVLSLFIVFIIFYHIAKHVVPLTFVKRLLFQLSHAASQIQVRGALSLILLFVILSQFIDAEIILGAFLAGILMSFFSTKERSSLLMKLDGMGYGFFIPVFFIMVGASIDLKALSDFDNSFLFLAFLLSILFAIKVIPSLIWTKMLGLKKAVAGGFLLSSRLSLIIVAAQVGLQLGVITPAMNTAFIIMAVMTCILSPIIFNQMSSFGKYRVDKTIIVGGGGVGVLLARSLKMHGKQSIIIEANKEKVDELISRGVEVIHGNGANLDIYKQAHLNPENYVVICMSSLRKKLKIAQILQRDLHHEKIVAYEEKRKNVESLRNMDIESLDMTQTVATAIENLIFRPATYHALFESFESFRVEEITIANRRIDGEEVKEIPFHQDGFLMLIKRHGEMIVPHGSDVLRVGDIAIVFGTNAALIDFRKKFTGN